MEVRRIKRPHGRRAGPEVVIDVCRRLPFFDAASRFDAVALPDVHAPDVADRVGLDQFDNAAIVVAGVDLRAHLCDGALHGGPIAHLADFPNVVGQRLLTVGVEPGLQGPNDGDGVCVVGCADDDGVELRLVDHAAIIFELGRARVLPTGRVEPL